MPVKAKFRCTSVTDTGFHKTVELTAVTSHKGDNADFAKYTPSGQARLTVDKSTPASDFFKPQADYYLTFEEATPVYEPVKQAEGQIFEGHEPAVRQ